jgi:diguanylate cyclase (GGDEF)-like protein
VLIRYFSGRPDGSIIGDSTLGVSMNPLQSEQCTGIFPGDAVLVGDASAKALGLQEAIPRCIWVATVQQLHAIDLTTVDVVLSLSTIADGCPLDVVAYVQGMRPELPVILLGTIEDEPLAIEAIEAGAMDFVLLSGAEHITVPLAIRQSLAHQAIRTQNSSLQDQLGRSLAELEVSNGRLEQMVERLEETARTDALTQVANRRWFNVMLGEHWGQVQRYDLPLALMMIDLDGFKALNDTLGHQVGDDMLRLAADVISSNCREVDLVARFGGDEFCVLMPHTDADAAIAVARRTVAAFRQEAVVLSGGLGQVDMSVGVAHRNVSEPTDAAMLLRHADEAMYGAKARGVGGVMIRTTPEVPFAV